MGVSTTYHSLDSGSVARHGPIHLGSRDDSFLNLAWWKCHHVIRSISENPHDVLVAGSCGVFHKPSESNCIRVDVHGGRLEWICDLQLYDRRIYRQRWR